MTVPTVVEALGVEDQSKVTTIMSNLGLDTSTDSRIVTQRILSRLVEKYDEFTTDNTVVTYGASVVKTNTSINTQRQTFTVFIDMALEVNGAATEPE